VCRAFGLVKLFQIIFSSTFPDHPRFGDARHEWGGGSVCAVFILYDAPKLIFNLKQIWLQPLL
jgi:hypothetical protein